MRRVVLSLFIALQAIYFVGSVCGNNLSPSKSMACCQHGQMDHMQTQDMASCCKHCDMGKNKSVVKLQRGIQKDIVRIGQIYFANCQKVDSPSFVTEINLNESSDHQTF